jgi:glucose/arabinose dehydrogenase
VSAILPRVRLRSSVAVLALAGAVVACGAADSDGTPRSPRAAAARAARLVPIGRFDEPLYVTAAPGDRHRIFVVGQRGMVWVVRDGRPVRRPFLDIRSQVLAGGERGLLSLAFAPDYARSGHFYVYFTARDTTERIVEMRRSTPDRANVASARLVLKMGDPEPNHNGGLLLFGPDRLMYIGTGDGGGANDQHGAHGNAQDLGSLLGKILRIDPRRAGGRPYRIPRSNPFVGRAGARGEIYSYGLRNPWRFAFDSRTGDLAIADVGQDQVEEVDFVHRGAGRGADFGWRVWEGNRRNFPNETAPGAVPAVLTHTHNPEHWCSITGGVFVRDPALPALAGRYVYGDFCLGRIRAARLRVGGATGDHDLRLPTVPQLSSFGTDARGRVYVTSLTGSVYRLASAR